MGIFNFLRNIKNRIVSGRRSMLFFVKLVNMPVLGNIYDFFYLRMIRNKINKSDVMVTIEPNNICNLRCIMCPYKRMERKKETMSMPLFKKIVNEAKELGCKEIHLTQYNEPFTDLDIFRRINYIRKSGMKSSFYSNATLLNEKIINQILENPPDLIRFSVDGAKKETFESIRVGANYEKVVENIKKLFHERNKMGQKLPVIEVYFTAFDRNRGEIDDFLKIWKGNCDFTSIYPVDSRESGQFVGFNYKKLKSYPCFNPKKVLVLSSGKVDMCCVDIDGEATLGDLKKQTLKEILNSEKYKQVYESQMGRNFDLPMCRNCSKFYIDSAFIWWVY